MLTEEQEQEQQAPEPPNPQSNMIFTAENGIKYKYFSKYGWAKLDPKTNKYYRTTPDEAKQLTQQWRDNGAKKEFDPIAPKTYGDQNQWLYDKQTKQYKHKDTRQIASIEEQRAADNKWHKDNLKKAGAVVDTIGQGAKLAGNIGVGVLNAIDNITSGRWRDNGVRSFQDPTAKYDRANAELMREQSADLQQSAQRNLQIANRDERAEADKDAAAIAVSEYQQKMSQISGAAGGGAAALASMNTQRADPNVHRQRADQAHAKGTEQRQEANVLQQQSMDARAIADDKDYRAALNTKQATDAHKLSTLSSMPQVNSTKVNDLQKGNNDTTVPENIVPENIVPENTAPENTAPETDNKIPGQKFSVYDLQQAFTILGGKTPSGDPSKTTAEGMQAAREYLISQFGSDPGTYDYNSPKSGKGTNKAHQYMQQMRDLYMEGLDKNRNVKTTVAATTLKKGTDGMLQDTNGDGVINEKDNLKSDKNLKHIIKAVNRRFL